MKKFLLSLNAFLAVGLCSAALAENRCYNYTMIDEDGYEFPVYGNIHRLSPNGVWATGGDEAEQTGSFVINTNDPENLVWNDGGMLLDIDNNGLAVGSWYRKEGYAKYKQAATFKDGEWILLPLPEQIIGQSQAVAISTDSKVIAGHGMCENENPDEPGKYFPIIWRLNEETGQYELSKLYNNLYLPGTFGFFVYDMTPNGRYICGLQCLDMGDTVAAVLDLETGEYKNFHEIEYKPYYFDYLKETYDCMFVDGMLDGIDEYSSFNGMLYYANDRYMFGSHAVASDAQEDGTGVITNYAAVYDIEAGEMIDCQQNVIYICGVDPQQVFTNTGCLVVDGVEKYVDEVVGTGDPVQGIYSIDDSGKIWGGAYVTYNAFGDQIESPVLVILDHPGVNGLQQALAELGRQTRISVADRVITVEGAQEVKICNANGMEVASGCQARVAPGVYVVRADGVSHKIIVK